MVSPRTYSQEYLRNGSSHQPSRRLPGKLPTPSVGAATVCRDGGRGLPAKLLRGGFRPRTLSREYLPNRRSHQPSQRLPGKLATPSVGAATACSDGGRGLLARGVFSTRPDNLARQPVQNRQPKQDNIAFLHFRREFYSPRPTT